MVASRRTVVGVTITLFLCAGLIWPIYRHVYPWQTSPDNLQDDSQALAYGDRLAASSVSLASLAKLNTSSLRSGTRRVIQQVAISEGKRKGGAYVKQAREALDVAWQFVTSPDGWTKEAGGNDESGVVYSKYSKKYGKMFKLVASLDIDADVIHSDLAKKAENMPKWNPTLIKVKILEVIDNRTSVVYNIAAPAAGGMVSSRDFVFVTYATRRESWYVSAFMSITHPAAPVMSEYVRGEQAPGCMRFLSQGPGKSRMEWLLNTNLKGWLSQYMVDKAMSSVLLEYLSNLQRHVAELMPPTAAGRH